MNIEQTLNTLRKELSDLTAKEAVIDAKINDLALSLGLDPDKALLPVLDDLEVQLTKEIKDLEDELRSAIRGIPSDPQL